MSKLNDSDIMDINILFAMTKCMSEIAHGLQYKHTHQIKHKIKKIIKTVDLYEKEINKTMDGSDAVENIYDCIMELVLEAKELALKK
tara:strand:+ start:259 stop:519 length:261 start_codon:yes stop_codon:yes gene_type:complete